MFGEFASAYTEIGVLGCWVAMFMFLVYSMNARSNEQSKALEDLKIENRGQSETIENVESILLKLLTRMDKTDDRSDRRHSDLSREISDLVADISEVKGSVSRINGRS